jgi:putative transposase
MPWREIRPMDSKLQFISFALESHLSMTELCSIFSISRKTGYKWLARYIEEGPDGLNEKSRAPNYIPHKTSKQVADFIVSCRRKHPSWGARKITQKAEQVAPKLGLPSETTINNIIKCEGLTRKKRKRRKPGHPGRPSTTAEKHNDIWTTDYKGEFKTKDGEYCYPLTILDEYSRYLLKCQGLPSTGYVGAFKAFKRAFREYGLPQAIKSDNGIPFATTGIARLSKLSVWWIKLGINPILIQPGSPYQNGVHERMHKTLKSESTIPPAGDLKAQQRRFNRWREEYNFERPHESLGGKYPSQVYKHSLKEYPSRVPDVDYPDHFEVRFVSANHCFRWNHKAVPIGSVLVHEYVGLEEVMDGIWAIYFSWKRLGFLDEKKMRIIDDLGRLKRKKSVTYVP